MNKAISQKIYFLSFFCMVLLVFIHAYNVNYYPLYPTSTIDEPFSTTNFIELFFANGLLRFRIPLLMLVSGYLLAYKPNTTYRENIEKKVRTLLLPYLLFSGVTIVFVAIIEHFILPNNTLGLWGKKISNYSLHDFAYRLIISPIPFQLWFLRVVFMFVVLYPVIVYCLKKAPKWFLSILFILAIVLCNNHYTLIFYFAVGIYLQMQKVNITTKPSLFNIPFWIIVVLILVTLKTWVAINGKYYFGNFTNIVLQVLHIAYIIPSILVVWFGLDNIVSYFMSKGWFLSIIGSTFFIYGCHEPLMAILIKPFITQFGGGDVAKLITFFILPVIMILFSIGLNAIVIRLSPKLHNVFTGGRGQIKNI